MFMGCGRLSGRLGIVSSGMSNSTYQGGATELTIMRMPCIRSGKSGLWWYAGRHVAL